MFMFNFAVKQGLQTFVIIGLAHLVSLLLMILNDLQKTNCTNSFAKWDISLNGVVILKEIEGLVERYISWPV